MFVEQKERDQGAQFGALRAWKPMGNRYRTQGSGPHTIRKRMARDAPALITGFESR